MELLYFLAWGLTDINNLLQVYLGICTSTNCSNEASIWQHIVGNFKVYIRIYVYVSIYRPLESVRCSNSATSAMGADVSSCRLQARTKEDYSHGDNETARATMWRRYGGVSHRDEARVGVTNPFTVEAETTTVEPTECRSTPHRYNVIERCRVSVRIQTRAVSWMKTRVDDRWPTTAPSIEENDAGKHRMGTMPYERREKTEFTWWTRATESTWDELYTDRTTPTGADEERRANDDVQRQLIDGDRTVAAGSN